MARLVKGVILPDGAVGKDGNRGRVLNAQSKKREEPVTYSRLDGLLTSSNPKICIFRRLGGIGDVLMTTPVLKHIKRLLPNSHLVYATDLTYSNGALADIIRCNPYVDELMDYKMATSKDFDLFSDLTSTGLMREKPGQVPPNRIDMFAEQLGIDISSDPLPTYIVSDSERVWAQKLIKNALLPYKREDITLIGLQIKSNDSRRTWSMEYNKQLIKLLTRNPKTYVALFHWEPDNFISAPQTFNCNYTLKYTAAIVDQCDTVVVPDSAILHIAGALQKKIVGIFGPIPPESRINYYSNATAVTAGLPCQYCWYSHSCGGKTTCLDKITPEMVYSTVMSKLDDQTHVQQVISQHGTTGFKPDNIVLVKRHFGGFGDIIQSMTAIEALSTKYPTKKIYYALPKRFWPAAENSPVVEKLLDADKEIRNNHYSVVIDISTPCAHYESSRVRQRKPVEKSRVQIFSEALGVKGIVKKHTGSYYVSKEEEEWAKDFLPKTYKPRICVAMRCAEEYRNWPHEKYDKLIPLLTSKFQVVIIDPIREFHYDGIVDACGFPFRKAAAIVNECSIVLTPDTSILHLAAALKKRIITLFGPIDPQARCKGYENITIVTSKMSCIPCWRNQETICKKTGSKQGYSKCMENIAVKDVYNAVMEIQLTNMDGIE